MRNPKRSCHNTIEREEQVVETKHNTDPVFLAIKSVKNFIN